MTFCLPCKCSAPELPGPYLNLTCGPADQKGVSLQIVAKKINGVDKQSDLWINHRETSPQ